MTTKSTLPLVAIVGLLIALTLFLTGCSNTATETARFLRQHGVKVNMLKASASCEDGDEGVAFHITVDGASYYGAICQEAIEPSTTPPLATSEKL